MLKNRKIILRATLAIVLLNMVGTISCQEPAEKGVAASDSSSNVTQRRNVKHRTIINDCKTVNKSGIYQLEDPAVTVYCDKKTLGGGWLVIQQRVDLKLNFTRSWKDYREGFGVVGRNKSFWLGNEAVHRITNGDGFELAIEWNHPYYSLKVIRYSRFRLAGEDEKYRMTVGGLLGSTYDALEESNNMKFSTFDSDNGPREHANCAGRQESGWWFSGTYNCGFSNLNYYKGPFMAGLGTFSRMMIRRK